jgi:Signal transduction histidine kinase
VNMRIRRCADIACASLLAILIMCLLIPVHADAASDAKTVRIGFFEFSGYHMIAKDGTKSGYGYDFLQNMGRYTNWKYKYVGYNKSWAEMQEMLKDGRIDLLTSAQKTPEREKYFAFSSRPIGTSSIILTVKSGNDKIIAGEYSTYDGIRVGLLRGSSRNETFKKYAAKKGFSYKAVYFDNTDSMTRALQKGKKVDALVTSNLRQTKNEWIYDQFGSSDFYVMVRKSDTKLLKQVNRAIRQMDENSPGWRVELRNEYYKADTGDEISFTAAERKFIKNSQKKGKVYTAIVNPDRNPYSYFENGVAKGIMPDIFKEIEKRTGLKFKILNTESRADYFQCVKNGDADVQIDAIFDYYSAEKNGYKLTDYYLSTPISKITRKNTKWSNKTVAVLKLSNSEKFYRKSIDEAARIITFDTIKECADAVAAGKADAAYYYAYSARTLADSDVRNRLTATIMPQYTVKFAVGVSEREPTLLLTILNKAVNSVQGDYAEQAVQKNTQEDNANTSIIGFIYAHPLAAIGLMIMLAALAALGLLAGYRKRNLTTISRKNDELAAAVEAADRANAAKSEFLSRVSHEIRTPMNAIVGIASIAEDHTEEPEKMKEYLGKIANSSHVLISIINDVLDMSAIESDKIQIGCVPFDLSETIDMITSIYGVQFAEKDVAFSVDDFTVHKSLKGDPLRLNQILVNLISNAYKFTDEGSVNLTVTEQMSGDDAVMIRFVVADTGCGMSDELMGRLFQPFEQESPETARERGGSGLGLSIAKRLTELMGGTIAVNSRKNEGTIFTAELPFTVDTARDSADVPAYNDRQQYMFGGLRVLLAEDNEINREIATQLLAAADIRSDIAENGQIAYEKFSASEEGTYDAILMDMQMPVMDGCVSTAAIRSCGHPQAKTIPIIAVTANAYSEDIRKCMDAGMNSFISKPFDPRRLYSEIARWCT